MRGIRIIVAAVCLSAALPLCAGIHQHPEIVAGPVADKDGVQPVPFDLFRREVIRGLPAIRSDKQLNEVRESCLKTRDELLRRERTGRATDEDLVNLSACLLRLGETPRAVEVLTPLARQTRDFRLLANLAMAEYLSYLNDPNEPGRRTRAISYLGDALAVWPKEAPEYTAEQLLFLRRAEELLRDLWRARARELARDKGERGGLDALFGPRDNPVRFLGPSGEYEAGKIAPAEREKLPKDAVALVQQLLIWLPDDTRLYWLYGELLNAQGDVKLAREVINDCVDLRRDNDKLLQTHRRTLNAAAEEAAAAASRIGWVPESWQLYAIGGAAGLVVLVLLYFQFREMIRHSPGKG